jgi:hypothetical protein
LAGKSQLTGIAPEPVSLEGGDRCEIVASLDDFHAARRAEAIAATNVPVVYAGSEDGVEESLSARCGDFTRFVGQNEPRAVGHEL